MHALEHVVPLHIQLGTAVLGKPAQQQRVVLHLLVVAALPRSYCNGHTGSQRCSCFMVTVCISPCGPYSRQAFTVETISLLLLLLHHAPISRAATL